MRLSLPGGRRERSSLDFKCKVSSSPIICFSTVVRTAFQARRQIFVFVPPIFFLAPHRIFLGGRSCCYWAEKTLKFAISVRKSLRISAKTFFFLEITCFWLENLRFRSEKAFEFRRRPFFLFLEITCFWSENFRFRSEKAFGFRRKPFFFFEITCDFGQKNSAKTFALLILILPPPISRSGRRPCRVHTCFFCVAFLLLRAQKFTKN